MTSVLAIAEQRATFRAIPFDVIALQRVQRSVWALWSHAMGLPRAEIGHKELHQLLPVGFLIVVLLVMLLLAENECVVNGDVHQVPQQVQHGEPCAAVGESGGFEKTETELLSMNCTHSAILGQKRGKRGQRSAQHLRLP